ncbi:DinB family protein [Geomonas propionica]|uniref:DinB family protein n=1 Tax=Geomonas propionica TaxID=2798582 RepID=A0ABS0YVJ3_9BACT|nr:DinB family protein [Geomonas propionica]MBJ6801908.1 DinB family protein [Geomonas propionica]
MAADAAMRKELLALLQGGNAHFDFEEVLTDLPPESINAKAPNTHYSLWHFVEHLRIAQWDILEFIRNPAHRSPEYPAGYRPPPDRTTDETGWRESCDRFLADLEALKDMVRDEKTDLLAPLPHAPGYSIFREVLLAADHNAYHIGEIAILRQVMGLWPVNNRYLTGSAD